MKLDPNQSKAYAGGISGAGTFLAGSTVAGYLTTVITWLLSYVGSPPPEVAQAISFLLVVAGSYFIGHFITYNFPPNQTNPDGRIEAYIAEIEKKVENGEGRGETQAN